MSTSETNNVGFPALRFPGLDAAWTFSTLGAETNYTKGFAFKSGDYRKSGVRIIRVSDLAARNIKKDNNNVHIEKSRRKEFSKWKIRENEIIITTVGSRPDLIESAVGRGIFVDRDDEGVLNQNMLKLKSEHGNASRFIFSQINTPRYTDYVAQIKRGNANQANITVKDLMAFRIAISDLPEQRKIADFLTAVDGRIGQLIQKKALLEDYKKGVMQQLFSQTIRFKDNHGNDFPDWEEKTLGEVGTTYGGLSGKSGEDFGSGKPFVTYNQIFDRTTIDLTKCKLVTISAKEKQNKVRKGDVLFTTSSETRLEVGYTSVVLDDAEEVYLNSFCFGFRMNGANELLPEFARYLFHSSHVRRKIAVLGQGSTRYNISKIQLMKQVFDFPSIPEQTKIADFLSAIDRKIESVSSQVTETQTFKRGLLQQMFV